METVFDTKPTDYRKTASFLELASFAYAKRGAELAADFLSGIAYICRMPAEQLPHNAEE
jgi:hypothetical protein